MAVAQAEDMSPEVALFMSKFSPAMSVMNLLVVVFIQKLHNRDT